MAVEMFRIPHHWVMTDAWTRTTLKKGLNDREHCRKVFAGEAVNVVRPDGPLLFALRPAAIPLAAVTLAFPALLRVAKATHRRGHAAAGQEHFYSTMVGYHKGHRTAVTAAHHESVRRIIPLLQEMNRVFHAECPDQYAVLARAALHTPPEALIPGTVFTSAQVNRHAPGSAKYARMAVHRDGGNLEDAYGVMVVIRDGHHTGGWLVFPQYQVAARLTTKDCLICDNRQAHGNTPILCEPGAERLSVVGFYHAGNLRRDTSAQ
jgi:hypothetical protein